MWKEFREFISRGNVIDLAVAVIIGAAFGAIVTSLVQDIIMPLIGIIIGGISFSSLIFKVGTAEVKYGNFIQAVVYFIIIAFVIFLLVRGINSIRERLSKPKEAEAPKPPSQEVVLLTEIRDLLRQENANR